MKTVAIWRLSPYVGGTEISLIEMARFLALSGYEVWVYGSDRGVGPIAQEYGITISTEMDILKHRHDILLWYDDFGAFRNRYGTSLDDCLKRIPYRFGVFGGFASRLAAPFFTKAIAKSSEIAAWLPGHGIQAAKISQFPIDLEYWKAQARPAPEVPIVGYIGRVENKNIKQLLSIVDSVPGCKARLVISTRIDPDEIATMSYEILQDQPLMKPHYQDLDIFMMTSLKEGVPRVLMEAMAMSLPVVTWGIGGIPSLNPKFMLKANSVSEAMVILRNLVISRDLRMEVGAENRRRIEAYDRRIREDLLAWFGSMT